MDPLSAAASVIACYQLTSEVVCQCLRYVRGVRGAHKDGDLVVAQIQMFQLSLHHLQGMLANEAANPKGGSRLRFLQENMNGHSASLLLCSKELEEIRAKLVKAQSGGNLREVFHKLSWPLKQEEVDRAITTLNSFAAAVDRGLAIDSNEVVRGIDSTTKDINSTTKQILISTESAEAQQKRREKLREDQEERQKAERNREQILDWLAHPDPSEIHNIASRARKSTKTGRWFLDGAAFKAFRKTPRSILWLHGDSGCGKTILCSAIIDDLRAIQLEEPRYRVAYWYFSVNDANRRSLQNLVRALLTQLCSTSAAPPALLRLWDANRKGREAPQISEAIQTLVQILGEDLVDEVRPRTFIVIDALDESNEAERAEILDTLQRIASLNIDIHLLVTSRSSTGGVEQRLQDVVKLFNVVIEHRHADEDILTHITERLQNDEDLNKWSSDLRKMIEEALAASAAGMFRWADCQLQAIRRCMKPKELRKTLTSLPKDLREFYANELANVEDRAAEDVRKLLGWLTYPQRPLRIEEAAEMLAVDLDSDLTCFDEGNRMPRPDDILKICGSLVRIDHNPKGRNSLGDQAEVQTLTAAHASVVDFLKEERVLIGRELEVLYTSAAVNLEMAETCLVYLLEIVEGRVVLRDDNIMSYPLARFSAELWDDFYREVVASSGVSEVDMTRVNALIMRLFASREIMLKWIQLCDPDEDTYGVQFDFSVSDVKHALYYAALLGLPEIVSQLIEDGHSIDEMADEDCGTALTAACVYERENVTSILLDKGADPNLLGDWGRGCPLAVAIELNHNNIVNLLLKTRRVDVNARRYPSEHAGEAQISWAVESVIYIAAESGRLEMVTSLLEAGADPNIEGGEEHTALQVACCGDSVDIVETLLEHGADPNLHGGRCGSALHAAFSKGNEVIIRTLLTRGADVKHRGGAYCSVLQAAVDSGNEAAVKIALECGLSANEKGGSFTYPLLRATALKSCSDSMVRLLLEEGADPNLEREGEGYISQTYRTALQHAMVSESLPKANLLLDYGAKVNTVSGWLGTALHSAIYVGGNHVNSMIRMLVHHGADVNQKAENIGPPLCFAAVERQLDSVQFLIEAGAELDSVDIGGHSALHMAISNAEAGEELFDYFVSLAADPLLLDRRGCNGLHYAARASNLRALKKMLELGPDIDIMDGFGWTPLHWAAASTRISTQVIKALLSKGCNTDLKDKDGRTALDLAEKFGNSESVAILNETGKTYTDPLKNGASRAQESVECCCEGCLITPDFCGSESWYKCTDCHSVFDLCFRCIVDKDTLHTSGHSWSRNPQKLSDLSLPLVSQMQKVDV